jgi:hypothetical protein
LGCPLLRLAPLLRLRLLQCRREMRWGLKPHWAAAPACPSPGWLQVRQCAGQEWRWQRPVRVQMWVLETVAVQEPRQCWLALRAWWARLRRVRGLVWGPGLELGLE